jgi:SAM-dependent methyltransferase
MAGYFANPARKAGPTGAKKIREPETLTAATAIDWNVVWKEQSARRSVKKRDVNFWNKKAQTFFKKPWESNYPDDFVRIMEPRRCWTVLDMACGTGALAIPLSKYVRRVTAADFAPRMLDALAEQCKIQGIENITTINASWEDDWAAKGIGRYDVVIASRSLVVDDLQQAIVKLNSAARERVYISTIVGDGPHDRKIHEAVGRRLSPGPDYIYTYNLLHQLGIYANIAFIKDSRQECFPDHDTAMGYYDNFLGKLTKREKEELRRYLDEHLVLKNGKLIFDYRRTTRWAVMWWEKE